MGHHKLSMKATTLTSGLIFGIVLALLALFAMQGLGEDLVVLLADVFAGYEASVPGILLGATWGFLVGGVIGAIYAWIYNLVS